jgi:hypothetical protein
MKLPSNMKAAILLGIIITAPISGVKGQACAAGTAHEIKGNWYCSAVEAITYANFGKAGSYNKITNIDGGKCTSEQFHYSGALAPLNEEVRNLDRCSDISGD